jgi:hypothetical protein
MGARRFASLTVTWLCLVAGFALCWAVSAQATEVHVFAGSFGSEGSGPGQFKSPQGVAVNDTTGEVYVADSANNRVQELTFSSGVWTVIGEFDGAGAPTGTFSEPTLIAVDNSTNPLDPSADDVYVVDQGHGVIDKFNSSGVYEGQLTGVGTPGGAFKPEFANSRSITGIALDQNGVVWVSTFAGSIYSFSDAVENKYTGTEVNETLFGTQDGLAVDTEGNLYFGGGTFTGTEFTKVNSSGIILSKQFGGDNHAIMVAVDPVDGEVYLGNNVYGKFESIENFSLSGMPIESSESGALAPSFGSGYVAQSKALAVDASTGTVYVVDHSGDKVVAFEEITLPSVKIGAVSEQEPRSLTLNGTVNPEGSPVTSCVFEYGPTSAYGQSASCSPDAGSIGSSSGEVAVSAHLAGLVPGSTYHYRLAAKNAANIAISTPDRELVAGPVLGLESAVEVASSSATLQASIDPNGADTHYYFEYGPTVAYGSYVPVSPPGEDLGSAVGRQPVSVHLQGLRAGTAYHYRLVASQDGEVFEEPDESFTPQLAGLTSMLPDGRAWELVSPADKKGALIEFFEAGGQIQAASNGSGITYLAEGPHVGEGALGKIKWSQVLSRRGLHGWESEDLTLAGNLPENGEQAAGIDVQNPEYQLFSPDLSVALVDPLGFEASRLSPEATEATMYLRDNENKRFVPLVSPANVPPGTKIDEPKAYTGNSWAMFFLAATPDLRHIVFKTPMALTPAEGLTPAAIDDESEQDHALGEPQWNLYEWNEGKLQLVNVLPNGEATSGDSLVDVPRVRLAGSGNIEGKKRGGGARAVSNDGRLIAWTLGEFEGPFTIGEALSPAHYKGLFVRDMVEERTVQVGGQEAVFQTMNSDGSKIFYLEKGDLYVFEYETGEETDLTEGHGSGESSGGVKEAVSDVSEDGSYVYFVATGVLAKGGEAGDDNLYLLHDADSGWQTTYIATLSGEDQHSWYQAVADYTALPAVSSRVSPDGRYLAFMSNRPLTGYDNDDANSGVPDQEVYLYDAQTGKLACASCNPTGARPVGVFDDGHLVADKHSEWAYANQVPQWLAGSIPGWDAAPGESGTYQPNYLNDSGRLFFDSPDGLVPQATNGLEDVYEYEPAGIGDCVAGSVTYSERSGGCVSLISPGTSNTESAFYDASENDDDAFFITKAKLVSEDYDDGYDVYDAHVCSVAVPCVTVPVSAPPCDSGDSCKAAPSPQPEIFGPTPSATFNGIGNVIASPSVPAVKTKSLTNAQNLARALKVCRKEQGKRRSVCEARARKRHPVKQARKAMKTTGKGGR